MIINTDNLSEALESILSNSIAQCEDSYQRYKKSQHGGVRSAYAHDFNVSYATLAELEKIVVESELTEAQRLNWDKVKVLHASINNLEQNI